MAVSVIRADDAFPPAKRDGWPSGDWRAGIGVPGGIPAPGAQYTNPAVGLTGSQMNTVIQNCPSNQHIKLNAGVYDFGGTRMNLSKDGVEIIGSVDSLGVPTTIISNCYWHFGKGSGPSISSWAEFSPINISSGLTEGSFAITLASAPNSEFAVGAMMVIDQTDDGTLVKSATTTFAHRPSRCYSQVVLITNISGSVISFDPPLIGKYWNTGQDPEAFGFAADYSGTLFRSGMRNVRFYQNGGDLYGMHWHLAYACWTTNVYLTGWGDSGGSTGTRLNHVSRSDIIFTKYHDKGVVTSSSYALNPTTVSMCRIEHNIFTNLALAMPTIGMVGCSVSYNVGVGPLKYNPDGWLAEYFFCHGGHSHDNLYEGNWLEAPIWMDAIFDGNNSYNAIIRNRIQGWSSPEETNSITTIRLEADMDHMTILGNVLGWDGSEYSTYGDHWQIDASVQGLIRTNNYNCADNGVNSAETMSPNTMQTSYRYPDKPAEWADLPWPGVPLESRMTNVLQYTNLPAGFWMHFGYVPTNAQAAAGATRFQNRGRALRSPAFVP